MARRSPQTQAKRQREFDKAQKRRDKAEKRALRKAQKTADPTALGDAEENVSLDGANSDSVSPDVANPEPSQD